MLPERLEYIDRVQKFLSVLVESAKTNQISEADFYMILGCKCKALNKERMRNKVLLSKRS